MEKGEIDQGGMKTFAVESFGASPDRLNVSLFSPDRYWHPQLKVSSSALFVASLRSRNWETLACVGEVPSTWFAL